MKKKVVALLAPSTPMRTRCTQQKMITEVILSVKKDVGEKLVMVSSMLGLSDSSDYYHVFSNPACICLCPSQILVSLASTVRLVASHINLAHICAPVSFTFFTLFCADSDLCATGCRGAKEGSGCVLQGKICIW
jgi:hypothetical protein